MCFTGHFIDGDWKLCKKILSFCLIVGHSGEVMDKSVARLLLEW